MMPINQVANVTLADARTIAVQPWEKKMVQVVEKAIRDSDLGLNPATSGDLIRVPMPALTEDRRKELIKVVRHEAENARIAVRNIRRDTNEHLKKLLKDHEVSEDDERHAQVDRTRRRVPDAFCFFERELAPPCRGGLDPDAALPACARAGSGKARRERHPVQGDRRYRALRAANPGADRGRRGAYRAEYATDPHCCRELRRTLGHRASRAQAHRGKPGGGTDLRARSAGAVPVDGLRAGTGPVYPHRRRAEDLQLPALAARLRGVLLYRYALARLRRRCAGDGDRVLPAARAPFRAHQRAGRGERLRFPAMLKTRILTAAVLIPLTLGALFWLGPIGWGVFTLAIV